MEGACVFWQRHQERPAFDLQPKGRDSGVPGGKELRPSALKLESGKKSSLGVAQFPLHSFWELEINIVEKDTFYFVIVCSVFKLLRCDIIFSTVVNLIDYTRT